MTPAYHFCAKCGGRLAVREIEEQQRLICEVCGFVHYVNPRPTVAALVLDGDRVLLVRRAVEPRQGSWDVPGGFLEVGEHPVVGLKRELREETSLEIEPVALHGFFLDAYPEPGESTLNIYFLARIVAGTPQPASDVDAVAWFHRDALPDDIAFRNNCEALEAWRRGETHVLMPGWPLGTVERG